ncbi:MAG TPA: shikimate dehydrogenase [Bryobacteraceae bacterium]|nr:shikimate dehydrogenase [Bryobacteraceae bacterium]
MKNHFLMGLIGSGIAASKSPEIHESEGRSLDLEVSYKIMDLNETHCDLPTLLDLAERRGCYGVNVTYPCKQEVMRYLTEIAPEAMAIGAVNTVTFQDGQRRGYNTDAYGFARGFQLGLPGAALESVLLVGAGGAGSAAGYAALEMGVGTLRIFDELPGRAAMLAERLCAQFGSGRACATKALEKASGLIHATPVGMAAHPGVAVPRECLDAAMWVAEIVYVPLETELLRVARSVGCRTVDGGGMAVYQAARAFYLFTGMAPNEERMLARFRGSL